MIARASRAYAERGPADEVTRFLFNAGILIQDPEGEAIYLDDARGKEVLECCEQVCEPAPTDSAARLLACRTRRRQELPDFQEPPELQVLIEPEDRSEEMPDQMPAPCAMPVEALALIVAGDPMKDFVPIPPPETLRRLMYLTPIEMDVWVSVAASAEKHKDKWRLAVPSASALLYEYWCSAGQAYDEEDYLIAFRRFVEYGVLNEVGDTSGERKTYELRFDPTAVCRREIEARSEASLEENELPTIREAQWGDPESVPREDLGIIEIDVASGERRVCVIGFERYEFVTPVMRAAAFIGKQPTKPQRGRSKSKLPPACTAKDLRNESDACLATQHEDLQKKIECAQTEIISWTGQLKKLDAEVSRRRDSKRQELLRQKAEIDRQLAALDEA